MFLNLVWDYFDALFKDLLIKKIENEAATTFPPSKGGVLIISRNAIGRADLTDLTAQIGVGCLIILGADVQTEDAIIQLLREMRDEGRVMLVSTHNLGSVPEFCDRTILIKETVIAYGPTQTSFTRENLELAFGGVLRHFVLGGADLHDDDDRREIRVITDDERPFVLYDNDAKAQKDDWDAAFTFFI